MAYSSNRGDWNRDRDERWSSTGYRDDDDDARRARESMERDRYGHEGRGGYGGRGEYQDQRQRHGQDYNRGYHQGDYDQDYGRNRESWRGEGRRHYGNESGGWEGREREQWRNRHAHGDYDRNANYGRYGSSGGGNYGPGYAQSYDGQGYGGEADHGRGRGFESNEPGSYGASYGNQGGYRQSYGNPGLRSYSSSGRPSGGRAYGDYSGSPSGYFGDESSRRFSDNRQWGSQDDYGEHRGRGPRGYKRSDERIREDVCDCLTDDDRLDATNIEVSVKDGEVTLSGTVTSRDDKRWAELLTERISGVKEVQNSVRVQEPRSQSTGGSSLSGTSSATETSTSTGTATTGRGKESNIAH